LKRLREARTSNARTERELAILRVAEALRLYAAGHGSRLPASLSDIDEVPIPLDPVTEAPFNYRFENEQATISGPSLPNATSSWEVSISRQ
jgi:hypothetical protein